MKLTADQENVVDTYKDFLLDPNAKTMRLSGGSGTGKTTVTKSIVQETFKMGTLLSRLTGSQGEEIKVIPTATTNKAAEVLSEKIGMHSSTIHSVLSVRPYTDYRTGKQYLKQTRNTQVVDKSILIIDESSAAGEKLKDYTHSSTKDCKVLWIGDKNQLTSVNESSCAVFTDPLIDVDAELTQVLRQGTGSQIPVIGAMYRDAVTTKKFPMYTPNGKDVIYANGPDIEKLIRDDFLKNADTGDIKILLWSNKKVNQYNKYIRGLLGKTGKFQPGELLVSASNILDSNNGPVLHTEEMLTVLSVDPKPRTVAENISVYNLVVKSVRSGKNKTIMVPECKDTYDAVLNNIKKEASKRSKAGDNTSSELWARYYSLKEAIADVRPTHASTVHKAQGSTHKRVYIDLTDIGKNNRPHEVARMLYVAVTRASEQVYLFGTLPPKYWGN